jgi:hypothetical protein
MQDGVDVYAGHTSSGRRAERECSRTVAAPKAGQESSNGSDNLEQVELSSSGEVEPRRDSNDVITASAIKMTGPCHHWSPRGSLLVVCAQAWYEQR